MTVDSATRVEARNDRCARWNRKQIRQGPETSAACSIGTIGTALISRTDQFQKDATKAIENRSHACRQKLEKKEAGTWICIHKAKRL